MGQGTPYIIFFYHNGKFVKDNDILEYINGDCTFYEFDNIDFMGWFSFLNY